MTETQLIKACTEAGIKTEKGIATKKMLKLLAIQKSVKSYRHIIMR